MNTTRNYQNDRNDPKIFTIFILIRMTIDKPNINDEDHQSEFTPDEEPEEEAETKVELQQKEELTLEEKLAYQKIRNKIIKWKNSFKKETEMFKLSKDLDYKELIDLEKQIEYAVGTANAGSMIQSTVFGISTIVETKSSLVGFHLKGYSATLMSNENFRRLLLELECIHGGNYSSPYYRLASTMFYTAGIVHLSNSQSMKTEMESKIDKDIKVEKATEYQDL